MKYIISYVERTDKLLWLLCFALSSLSVLLIFGIIGTGYAPYLHIGNRNIAVQAISIVIGAVSAVIVSLFDYKDLAKLWKIHGFVCYALLIATFFIGVGVAERPDDRRWLEVPFANILLQPAELLRVSFILMFAYHIYLIHERINHPLYLGGVLLHGLIPVVIIQLQGDSGSALIFLAMIIAMVFAAGISWKYIIAAIVAIAAAVPLVWFFVLNSFQQRRILALYQPTPEDLRGFFFQQNRALTAFAMGGTGGRGLFAESYVYVPAMHTDFIFAFLGEAFGFVGCLLTVLVMTVMWLKILAIGGRAKDLLGKLICTGVFAMLSFQAVINIGMNIAVLPVIGNTLPFLSYGGSSMLTSFIGIGLVLAVHMHSAKSMFE